MRVITIPKGEEDTIELSYMWLPMFIGMNKDLLIRAGKALEEAFPMPFEATEDKLDEIHQFVVNWLCDQIKIDGLREYLEAIKHIEG